MNTKKKKKKKKKRSRRDCDLMVGKRGLVIEVVSVCFSGSFVLRHWRAIRSFLSV